MTKCLDFSLPFVIMCAISLSTFTFFFFFSQPVNWITLVNVFLSILKVLSYSYTLFQRNVLFFLSHVIVLLFIGTYLFFPLIKLIDNVIFQRFFVPILEFCLKSRLIVYLLHYVLYEKKKDVYYIYTLLLKNESLVPIFPLLLM